jgi:uncharacterized protein YxjI
MPARPARWDGGGPTTQGIGVQATSATVRKRLLRVRDTYGVAVVPGQNDALVLAVTVCIDHLTEHDH